jgi:glucose-1-phosphate adenylyltransferase
LKGWRQCDVTEVITVIMAGGMGERLKPLTRVRTKPAVPFGGIYRIIDFTLSNCVNSDLRQIYVLTQYKSHSLGNHLRSGWDFLSRRLGQFIDVIPAQMQTGSSWYRGTADAIRQNMSFLRLGRPEMVLILSGDHIYKMDYRLMLRFHRERRAALTVSAVRVPLDEARGQLGVLRVDGDGRVVGFEEKPAAPAEIAGTGMCLASMGIYVFDYDTLEGGLADDRLDFGKDVIPHMIKGGEDVYAFDFSRDNVLPEYEYITEGGQRIKTRVERASDAGYWRDVGTIPSFWTANLDLVAPRPRFNLYSELWPLFCFPQHSPPVKFVHEGDGRTGRALNSVVSDGVIVSGALVRNSVLSPGVYIHSFSVVESSVLLGGTLSGGEHDETQIGRHSRIRNAVIDKNVRLSEGTQIGFDREEDRRRGLTVTDIPGSDDYVVTVPKGCVL